MSNASQLTLMKTTDSSHTGKTEQPKSWQQTFAGIFWYKYKEVTGEPCKLGFGALKKMLNQHAVKYWVDEETGQPEVPSVEAWQDEVNAFFSDAFAATSRGFHFSYLLKQFGSFKKYTPAKREEDRDSMVKYTCKRCGSIMRQRRSVWLRHKNTTAKCTSCNTAFHVNDVLNAVSTIQEYLPHQEGQ